VKSFEATEKGMSQETTDKVYKLPGTIWEVPAYSLLPTNDHRSDPTRNYNF
jgi:hypothetical protein